MLGRTILFVIAAALTGELAARDAVEQTFGDWTLVCAPAGVTCAVVTKPDGPTGMVTLELNEQGWLQGVLITPFRILEVHGVQLVIDGVAHSIEPKVAGCAALGCVVSLQLAAETVAHLRAARGAHFKVLSEAGSTADIALSLEGFSEALDAAD